MIHKGNPYQKKGNNTLFLVLGVLVVIFLGLIYVGSMQESNISQLISAAAPDSSAFANDSLLTQPPAIEEVEEEVVEEKKPEVVVEKDTAAPHPEVAVETTDSSVAKPAVSDPAPVNVIESAQGGLYSYKVKRGDTMYKIAAKFGNKPADVLALNGLTDMNLQADKEIKVKVRAIHNVANGEGLNAIAVKYGVATKSIKAANGLTSEALSDGAQLIIPLK